jgi:hypothetical protein
VWAQSSLNTCHLKITSHTSFELALFEQDEICAVVTAPNSSNVR